MEDVKRVVSLYRAAEGLQKEVKDILQCLESGKETKELAKLIDINQKIQEIRVRIDEVKDLVKVIEEAQGYVGICDQYLSDWSMLTEGTDKIEEAEEKTKYIQDLIRFRD